MKKLFIGIDNGVTGSIGIIGEKYSDFILTPTFKQQDYTKAKNEIRRINSFEFRKILETALSKNDCEVKDAMIMMERPVVNPSPKMFKTSILSARCFENELCQIESIGIGYMTCDSKEWQRIFLPQGTMGPDLKVKSKDIGCRMFPEFSDLIKKHKDADGIFIALYLQKKMNGVVK